MLYMVTWIPSIYPLYVSIYIPAPAGSVMGNAINDLSTVGCRKTFRNKFPQKKKKTSNRPVRRWPLQPPQPLP